MIIMSGKPGICLFISLKTYCLSNRLAFFFIATAAITLFRPFYYYITHHLLVGLVAFVLGMISIAWLHYQNRGVVNKFCVLLTLIWLLLEAWKLLPFRPNLVLGPNIVIVGLIISYLFLPYKYKKSVLDYFILIGTILAVFSFVIVLLLLIGINLPHFQVNLPLRNDILIVYPGAGVLSSQFFPFPIGFGGTIVRSSSIFVEPGHYGVFCGLLLSSQGFNFKSLKEKIILLGGISSFSGGFFAILIGGLLAIQIYYLISHKHKFFKSLLPLIFICPLMAAIFFNSTEEFQDRILWSRIDRIQSHGGLGASRAHAEFNDYFNLYKLSTQSIIGLGVTDLMASDWRNEVVKYGWPIIFLYSFFYFIMVIFSQEKADIKIGILVALIVIFLHRSSYIHSFLILSISSSALSIKKSSDK